MKRKHRNIFVGLFVLVAMLPSSLFADENSQPGFEVESEVESKELLDADLWHEYAIYLISQQLCGAASDSGKVASERVCVSMIAEMAAETVLAAPRKHILSSLENVNWNGSTELDGVARSVYVEVGSDVSDPYNNEPALAGMGRDVGDRLQIKDLPAKQNVENAIPGSLLVTILALVGIVAVARRDVSGKTSPRPLAGSRSDVARISSSREDVNIVR